MKKYISHIKHLCITITPGRPIYEGGIKVADQEGKYARFNNGEFSTDDEETIKKLESLPTFGFDFVLDKEIKEKKEENKGDDLTKKTKLELLKIASEQGITVLDTATKAEIIKLLTAVPGGDEE